MYKMFDQWNHPLYTIQVLSIIGDSSSFFFFYLLKGHQGRIYKLLIVHFGYSSTFNQKNSQIFTTKRERLASSMSNALH